MHSIYFVPDAGKTTNTLLFRLQNFKLYFGNAPLHPPLSALTRMATVTAVTNTTSLATDSEHPPAKFEDEVCDLPKTMKAATVVEFNAPLQILDNVAVPRPAGSQILVKIAACSLCMSDLAGHMGALGLPPPYCAGHEPVGRVVQLSKDSPAAGFAVGDRVGFMPASATCGSCFSCMGGNHRFCATKTPVGFSGPYGGFSEYAIADPLSTVKVPDGLTDAEAAPLLCAGVTAYSALKKVSKILPGGSLINVIGCGGVGHLAIAYAKAMGYEVQACKHPESHVW